MCPVHTVDGFLKNVGTASEMEWNESFFRDCFDNTTKIVTWVSTLFIMMKSVETRFESRYGMTERVMYQKKVYEGLVKDELFLKWLRKQPKPIRQEVHTVVIFQ